MVHFTPPAQPLTDGVLTLRLPSPALDTGTVRGYIERDQLDDVWLPGIPFIPAGQAVADWLAGWTGPSRDGPALMVTLPAEPRFVGLIGFGDRGQGVIEMVYGIAPPWRGRGLATRATRLAARWALTLPGVTTIELRIDQDHPAGQHVARNAGFTLAGTVTQFVPGTGQTFEDLRYVLSTVQARAS